ncbi:FlgD immunoglobulin-like domain containing protein [Micromonospora coxensis]|uniref:FlgD Ig-like domain-containing protein n=1 Tax=Micromonospora coxensis TaxID=356852 RepID=A0A1C5IT47_9ACTN|nr:FlgD immunoglobulin-like domain containing protein [Micromonospora coxensis]SCG61169.1 FlgD Ig-like domain-containing protein [Micromonospora coxensis]
MASGAFVSAAIAATVSTTLVIGQGPATTDITQHRTLTGEAVVPAAIALRPQTALLSAGPSGLLRSEPGHGLLWTSYDGDDTSTGAPEPLVPFIPQFGAGSDVVAVYDHPGNVTLRNMSTGRSQKVTLPGGHSYVSTLGSTIVTRMDGSSDASYTWRLLEVRDDGSVVQRAVEGVPDGIAGTFTANAALGDAHGQVVQYRIGATGHTGWLDVDQGRFSPLPYRVETSPGHIVVTPTHLLWWQDGTVFVHSRDDLSATPRKVPLTGDAQVLGMTGDRLVVSRYDASLGKLNYGKPVWRVEAVTLDGSPAGTLLARSATFGVPTPHGGLLVQGGPGPGWEQWGVWIVEGGDGGAPTVRRIVDAYPQKIQTVRALSYTQGRLHTLEYDPLDERHRLWTRDIGVAGSLTVGPRLARGALPDPCSNEYCLRFEDTGDGRTVVGDGIGVAGIDLPPHVLAPTQALPGTRIDAAQADSTVQAVSGRFASLRSSDGTVSQTRIVDLDTGKPVFTTTDHVQAMWGTTAWLADGNDAVTPVDVLTGERGTQVWFGRGCLLENVQAVGRWLRWVCGLAGTQGVFDVVTRKSVTFDATVPAEAKLGDGFVVFTRDGQLTVTDVRSGTPVTRTVGDSRVAALWDLDPYTGVIAHLAPDNGIHLVPSGVPVSPLVQLDATVATAYVKGGAGQWTPKWWLNKPAASWTLVIRNQATGATVRTLSGGVARGVVAPTWNGRDGSGALVADGIYGWALSVTPADGAGAVLTGSGSLRATGSACPLRSRAGTQSVACSTIRSSTG